MSTNEVKDIGKIEDVSTQALTIAQLEPKLQRFVHLYLTGQYTLDKLSGLLGVHVNTVRKWLKRSDVKLAIEETQNLTHEMVAVQLKALTEKAIRKLNSLVDSPIDGVALQAVKDVLDRAGHKPKSEIKVEKTVRTFEEKLNEVIKSTLDVEYEMVEDKGDVSG